MHVYVAALKELLGKEALVQKPFVDLTNTAGDSVIVVVAHITHISVLSPHESTIYLAGGKTINVEGTLNDIVNKIWPTGA